MLQKIILDKKISPLLRPIRWLYRKFRNILPSTQTLKQLKLNEVIYLVWLNEDIGKKMMITRSFESSETNALKKLIRKGDVCFDIGGNIGYYSLNMALLSSKEGKVFTFEPIKRNALVIELAAQLNALTNIIVENVAVSNSVGCVVLNIPEGDGAYAYLGSSSDTEGLIVPTITIDNYFSKLELKQVDIIKVDVEGAEMLVLEGAMKLIGSNSPPRVIMMELVDEYLSRFNSSVNDVLVLMGEYGYKPYYAINNGDLIKANSDCSEANFFFLRPDAEGTL
ncbi:FkbM family methyltransferase [Methylovulum miyakonense]|uniref:FkbM family methyltransferase n=1 Tax=Methylovulum miyakonense TaxID=645578 RepID=UPI000377AD02|nr:FkbM family methyltransferase [Methylovulum miyakonense]